MNSYICHCCQSNEDLIEMAKDFFICATCYNEMNSDEVYTYNPFEE